MMNNYAEKLHLKDTHFETVHGLDAPGQHSSAYDLAVLSRAIIHGEPEFYHMYSEKSLTWNGITQQNRNGLLWDKTMNVDGLKTGHTSSAGFNLIASAVDGQRRLIAVIMGADSAKGREEEARKLLRWGQQNFTTVQILHRGKRLVRNASGMAIKKISPWERNKSSGWCYRKPKFHISKLNIPLMVKNSPRQLAPISG